MSDPIKILFKFKNKNRRIQYHTYIFIGKVKKTIMDILKKIEDLSLFNTLTTLDESDYSALEEFYGETWYKKFFNTYHISNTIYTIKNNEPFQKKLISKYGKEWYNEHIIEHILSDKKIYYSYSSIIKEEKTREELRKRKLSLGEEDKLVDYSTMRKRQIGDIVDSENIRKRTKTGIKEVNEESFDSIMLSESSYNVDSYDSFDFSDSYEESNDMYDFMEGVYNILPDEHFNMMYGGNRIIDDDISLAYQLPDEHILNIAYGGSGVDDDNDGDGVVEFEEGIDDDMEMSDDQDEMDIDDLEKIYQDTDTKLDKNVNKTSDLIKQALQDDKIFKKTKDKLYPFDMSKDTLMYDSKLKDIFDKKYITTQYIYKDDTVKMAKNKICCSIYNNNRFGDNNLIIPSRQYLWSEYYFENKIEQVMIGQKWIKRTNLLQIDVEPNNNIKIYEELRGNLKLLKENIKRYGSKIKREDNDNNILYDYDDYVTNNELYLLDIFNELGEGYNPDGAELKNINDVFIRVYFPKIKQDDVKYIIEYLNKKSSVESSKLRSVYDNIFNDLIMINEVMETVEDTKQSPKAAKYFKENFITQSVIHINLKTNDKIDLFRIFNEFETTDKYPFIQYQTYDGQLIFKYNEGKITNYVANKDNRNVLTKWFENAPYGISFKVKVKERGIEKFMAINLTETGRVEYKTQWKESDRATIDDIKITYEYVKDLIKKLNKEKNKVKFKEINNNEFNYAFINSIQKFVLPDKFSINHNDLSDFSRYFFPYVALVIKPRKRVGKIKKEEVKSKFGTYLRYKRISKYENTSRIEQRVLYFMRNYEYNDKSLSNEISIQFNITIDKAMEHIEAVRSKYPNIKKSRKVLKKLENVPKYKPPGIGINIQGKEKENYKIIISGARDKVQLDRIIDFMKVLIFLYIETYLYKKPERKIFEEKLKMLTNIAKRRNQVDFIVNHEKKIKTIKQMAQIDSKRLGFKPEKGQNPYSRSCQNSGDDKRRRPTQYLSEAEIKSIGFTLDENTGIYNKSVNIKKGNKNKTITIRAVKLNNTGDDKQSIFYSCNPDDNGDHMYVGFLSKSNNPHGQCMPCCFKKDAMLSSNNEKKSHFMSCTGKVEKIETKTTQSLGEQLYILQDTNKLQEGRLSFLPKYLDIYLNRMIGKQRTIKHHYLVNSETGYFLKYGSKQYDYPFMNAVASAFDTTVEKIKNKMINILRKDDDDIFFTALNDGDIKTQFGDKKNFINYIKNNHNLPNELFNHFLSLPTVLDDTGVNIIIFRKQQTKIKSELEKTKIRNDFVIECYNRDDIYTLNNPDFVSIILIQEINNYYPIVLVQKEGEESKQVTIVRQFRYTATDDNIIHHISNFYNRNCDTFLNNVLSNTDIIAREANHILFQLDKSYHPKYQIIDGRNKCKYIVINNGCIIPIKPSGSIYNLPIQTNVKKQDLKEGLEKLSNLYKISKKIPVKPIGLYYSKKTNDHANIVGIMTKTNNIVPVTEAKIKIEWITKNKLALERKELYDDIDQEIIKGKDNIDIDDRIKRVLEHKFINESYELFRLEFSQFLNLSKNKEIKKIIETVIKNGNKDVSRIQIKKILYKLIDKNLHKEYLDVMKEKGEFTFTNDQFVKIIDKYRNLEKYELENNRSICNIHNKEECSKSYHCSLASEVKDGLCLFNVTKAHIIQFINKLSEELINDELKSNELLNKEDYFVSDIGNRTNYTEREGQKIIKSANYNIKKVLIDLFGEDNIPVIGKRRFIRAIEADHLQMNADHPIVNMGTFLIQEIIYNNVTIFRAFADTFYWVKQKDYNIGSRNLGYYGPLQTDLANYFRSTVIDWLLNKNNKGIINKYVKSYMGSETTISQYITKINEDVTVNTNCLIELFALNRIYKKIIYLIDDNNNTLFIFDKEIVFDHTKNKFSDKQFNKYKEIDMIKDSINIMFRYSTGSEIPSNIFAIYYK